MRSVNYKIMTFANIIHNLYIFMSSKGKLEPLPRTTFELCSHPNHPTSFSIFVFFFVLVSVPFFSYIIHVHCIIESVDSISRDGPDYPCLKLYVIHNKTTQMIGHARILAHDTSRCTLSQQTLFLLRLKGVACEINIEVPSKTATYTVCAHEINFHTINSH